MESKEYTSLLRVRFSAGWFELKEFFKVVWRYYRHPSFCITDCSLRFSYLFRSPYNLSKTFLKRKGEENVYAYGETPLTTMELIANTCGISKEDVVAELGCGRGRACFWLRCIRGCTTVGIEWIPEFVRIANHWKEKRGMDRLTFHCEDFLESDLTGVNVVYLYGTALSAKRIAHLANRLAELPSGTKIITVSYAFKEFAEKDDFELMRRFPAPFPWGMGDVYLQVRK